MMKRKADDSIDGADDVGSRKRTAIDPSGAKEQDHFRKSIFEQRELDQLAKLYSEATPFVFPYYHNLWIQKIDFLSPQI